MKKLLYILSVIAAVSTATLLYSFAGPSPQEEKSVIWYQVTVIESVVPGGVGRSRMISQDENGKMEEIKLENFFSMTGINFGNVMENDLQITNKISELSNQGWTLYDVTSGVYGGNGNNSQGIFITRYLFNKRELE
jgi:hypothetical protein